MPGTQVQAFLRTSHVSPVVYIARLLQGGVITLTKLSYINWQVPLIGLTILATSQGSLMPLPLQALKMVTMF
jgi:hypothetical protein